MSDASEETGPHRPPTDRSARDADAPAAAVEGEYDPEAVEDKWQDHWVDRKTFAYAGTPETDRDTVFSIDTPPPTVSGSLHWGHVYGSLLQDVVARFERMRGKEVFFPFGYDDNGIASERLTERELGIRHQDFSRRAFQEKCREVCREYEADFTEKMQDLGVSIDWDRTYKTIEPQVQRVSQLSFVDLYEQGREYRKKAPAIWCPECETAISQVEMEDAERDSYYNDVAFPLADPDSAGQEEVVISTTRPELLPACVAMFVHPEDEKNRNLAGETAVVPLFGQEIPILEDDRVDLEKGTGVVMSCTFGDQTDVEWYQAHDLPLRVAIDESATMTAEAGEYEGLSTHEAREAIAEDLDAAGYLRGRRAITHTVQVHERCDTDVEFRVSKQWYVRILDRTDEYLRAAREMEWFPEKMFARYEHWIEGLEWDWLISRQRDSGIPFPVWYCGACDEPVLAEKADLPVDPLADDPPVDACPECGHDEFEPEDDVFDTWATSSLTPLINAGWDWDPAEGTSAGQPEPPASGDADAGEYAMANPELYPMDLRPQGHDIISFWLFHTVVKCYEHTGEPPFESVMINGMILDEDRRKMSKSVGNVVAPDEVLAEYPVDAARYWATGSAVGDDLPYKETGLVAGEKLLRKLWNASKLVDALTPDERVAEPEDTEVIDEWLLAKLDDEVAGLTRRLEDYEFSKFRDELRAFFWNTFCDDYLEIAKQRLRDDENPSAQYALQETHRTVLKLFAPIVPHVTEEIWRASYDATESLHVQDWPTPAGYEADLRAGETAMAVISALRKYKTDHRMAPTEPLDSVAVYGDVAGFEEAIREAMHVEDLTTLDAEPDVETEIVDVDLDYATLGPTYGETVGEFDAAIEAGEFSVDGDTLRIAGEELGPDLFEVRTERTYRGEGEMVETEDAVVVVE